VYVVRFQNSTMVIAEGFREQGAEENVWTIKGGSNRKMQILQ